MRIFVTGATGFLGTAIVQELTGAGHQVLGLTRSEAGARVLSAAGAGVYYGDITDHHSLRRAITQVDAVIHTAFNHDFSHFIASCEADRQSIEAMGVALQGSARPLLITSGVGMGAVQPGQLASEEAFNPQSPNPRRASELAGAAVSAMGVDLRVIRLPQVHNTLKQGLITPLIELARRRGVSGYIDNGQTRWAAVHLSDAARVYRLALEQGEAGRRYHAVAEEGITLRGIAEAIAHGLNIPLQQIAAANAAAHFGWLNTFVGHEMSASGVLTQQRLNWQPQGPGLIADLKQVRYTAA